MNLPISINISLKKPGFWFALHDWQFPPYQLREIRWWMSGTPEVFRTGRVEDANNSYGVKLEKEWQFFWFDICAKSVFGRVSSELNSEERSWLAKRLEALGGNRLAFMNQHGLDWGRNYITGARMDKELPVLFSLICGGASMAARDIVRNPKGLEMVALEYFDATKSPPDVQKIDIATDPRIFMACNISRKKVPGGYHVFRFPKFSEPTKGIYRDCPVPLISRWPLYYPRYKMKWVEGTTKRNPYFP